MIYYFVYDELVPRQYTDKKLRRHEFAVAKYKLRVFAKVC